MKKLLAIPVMIVYLIAMSGIMISAHYCGQELESWSLFNKSGSCTDGGCDSESTKNDGCCKDKVITAKIIQDQNSVPAFELKLTVLYPAGQVLAYYEHQYPVCQPPLKLTANQPNAPPGLRQCIPLYKLHSSFIYYG